MRYQKETLNRNSKILVGKLGSITGPAFAVEICTILSILADSVVGQHYVDNRTVAAIALLSTFMTAVSMVHDLLATSVTPIIVEAKCKHGDKEAGRILGDLLFVVLSIYITMVIIVLIVSRPFLHLMTDDAQLINLALKYYYPILLTCPLNEACLCIERAYKTEGKAGFFSFRMVITNVTNILLDLFFVVVLKKGIEWLAYATVISSLLGYAWSMSYGFGKSCRIKPDFSKTFTKKRLSNSLKSQIRIGAPYFIGDIIMLAVTALSNKAILETGGTAAMTCVGVLSSIYSISFRLNNAIISNSNILFNALYIEEDKNGIRMTLKAIIASIFAISMLFISVITIFYIPVGSVYAIKLSNELRLLRICFITNGFHILWSAVSQFIRTMLISAKKEKISVVYTVSEKLFILVFLLIGIASGKIELVWLALGWASGICSIITAVILKKKKNIFGFLNDDQAEYSLLLETNNIVEASKGLEDILNDRGIESNIKTRIALLVEETGVLIMEENKERNTNADIRIKEKPDKICIYIYYDGKALSAEEKIKSSELDYDDLRATLISKLSDDFKYTRIVGLNCIELSVPKSK